MSLSLTGRPLDNPNPKVFAISESTFRQNREQSLWVKDRMHSESEEDDESSEEEASEIDAQEVFDLIRSISDPEFPLSSLEDLRVVTLNRVFVNGPNVTVEIRPTQPHCSSAALIGLAVNVRLLRALPPRFRVRFTVMEGSYTSPDALCKQLNDKERVAAACESPALMSTLDTMIARAGTRGNTQQESLV
ncbi:transcription-related protein [Mycena maculata]|uniref:Transcription-related protein n=1 Tax=Mycena maculata TaxID=230809 RepID=A0AAD7HEN5_9AGAR|nr:transcription-related protein [Mycena maculata]